MKCKDINFVSYKEGLYDSKTMSSILKHLKSCSTCSESYESINTLLGTLRDNWLSSRKSCLTPEQIDMYALDTTGVNERTSYEKHLSLCPYCSQELEMVKAANKTEFNVPTKQKASLSLKEIQERIQKELSSLQEQLKRKERSQS